MGWYSDPFNQSDIIYYLPNINGQLLFFLKCPLQSIRIKQREVMWSLFNVKKPRTVLQISQELFLALVGTDRQYKCK